MVLWQDNPIVLPEERCCGAWRTFVLPHGMQQRSRRNILLSLDKCTEAELVVGVTRVTKCGEAYEIEKGNLKGSWLVNRF